MTHLLDRLELVRGEFLEIQEVEVVHDEFGEEIARKKHREALRLDEFSADLQAKFAALNAQAEQEYIAMRVARQDVQLAAVAKAFADNQDAKAELLADPEAKVKVLSDENIADLEACKVKCERANAKLVARLA